MSHRIAYLSCDRLEGFYVYDELSYAPLRARGFEVSAVPWRTRAVDWNSFRAVVVRSTWDYQDSPGEFLRVLERIDASRAQLFNPLALMRWNLDKRYLLDLQGAGVEIVPTRILDQVDPDAVLECHRSDELVLKPTVSANADGTHRIPRDDADALAAAIAELRGRAVMVQPFLPSIVEEGEYSLFYFGGEYSHAILKTPAGGDFRVQEEHGGTLRAIVPEPPLLRAAERCLTALPAPALYARLDFARHGSAGFLLMEAELIEPSLYFQLDERSPERFAEVLAGAIA